jgi:hypothetical protein|tara:strand:+ start:1258 stop:1665 length:408 start_codon:yes stop_codon:yes gene_type:complete
MHTRQEKKIKVAASLLANIFLKDGDEEKLSFTELDHFSKYVANLFVGAIDTLGKAYSITSNIKPSHPGCYSHPFIFRDLITATDFNSNLLMGLVCELNAVNLLHYSEATKTEEYNHKIFSLTPLGDKFIDYLLKE